MNSRVPSFEVNHCHAMLNALRAALCGEESRLLSRNLLGLGFEDPKEGGLGSAVNYIEQLFSEFSNEETLILCLDETENHLLSGLFNEQLLWIPEQAAEAQRLLDALKLRRGNLENTVQELGAYFAGHARARETYIEGLLKYADNFSIPEMTDHWSLHHASTQTIVQQAKELLVEIKNCSEHSNFLLHRIYDYTVLIPASLRCQAHDMARIKHLDKEDFSFDDAHFTIEEAYSWQKVGLNSEIAGYWRAYGIDAEEYVDWVEFGFIEPRSAGSWRIRGFTAQEADSWALNGFDPAEADMYRLSGCDTPGPASSLRSIEQ